jgi:hypothetical protein
MIGESTNMKTKNRLAAVAAVGLALTVNAHAQDFSEAWQKARAEAEEQMRKQTALDFEFESDLRKMAGQDATVMAGSHYASIIAGYGESYATSTAKIAKLVALLGLQFYAADGSTYFESRVSDANGSSEYRVELRDYPDAVALNAAVDAAKKQVKQNHKKSQQ